MTLYLWNEKYVAWQLNVYVTCIYDVWHQGIPGEKWIQLVPVQAYVTGSPGYKYPTPPLKLKTAQIPQNSVIINNPEFPKNWPISYDSY
jgi:hypothetical protein